jgi:hypothetical protein
MQKKKELCTCIEIGIISIPICRVESESLWRPLKIYVWVCVGVLCVGLCLASCVVSTKFPFFEATVLSVLLLSISYCTMSVAFWSVTVEAGKSAAVQPPEGYVLNLIGAALDTTKVTDKAAVVVKAGSESIEGDRINAILGTLRSGVTDQISLGGLVFGADVATTFSVESSIKHAVVHLNGYFQPGPDEADSDEDEDDFEDLGDMDDEDDEDEDESEEEEAPKKPATPAPAAAKAATPAAKAGTPAAKTATPAQASTSKAATPAAKAATPAKSPANVS